MLEPGPSDFGRRLDHVLTERLAGQSRSQIGLFIRDGCIRVGGRICKPGHRLKPGEAVVVHIPPKPVFSLAPEAIPLNILHEDQDIIVIDKPAGMVVHPAPGNFSGTLVNALRHHCPACFSNGGDYRQGIVHRLDKETTGVLVVAKNRLALQSLSVQFKRRTVEKRYSALVFGEVASDAGKIVLPIGRHPVDRKKMSTGGRHTKPAETVWRISRRFRGLSLLRLCLQTGRTHQIRVHCAAINHPIVGDPVYAGHRHRNLHLEKAVQERIRSVDRQMLHARSLSFLHPAHGRRMTFAAGLPEDMQSLIRFLQAHAGGLNHAFEGEEGQ